MLTWATLHLRVITALLLLLMVKLTSWSNLLSGKVMFSAMLCPGLMPKQESGC